jgi:hypothetical protein
MQTFREIYMQYAKDQLVAREEQEDDGDNKDDVYHYNSNRLREQLLMPRIILLATFYDTVNTVKHNLSAVGVDVQSRIDDSSLLIVDAYNGYYPNIDGMKKLVASLSERATREGRIGVSAIVNMGFFFLYDGHSEASELINYEASLAPKTDGGNVRGFSCYHLGDYKNLNDSRKRSFKVMVRRSYLKLQKVLLLWLLLFIRKGNSSHTSVVKVEK